MARVTTNLLEYSSFRCIFKSAMPRNCSVCNNPDRESLERELINGTSYRDISRRFGATKDSIARHRAHLPKSLVKGHEAEQVARADNLLSDVRAGTDRSERLYALAEEILVRALEAKDLKTALAAITSGVNVMREGRAYLELRAEITGELGGNKPTPPLFGLPGLQQPGAVNIERMTVLAMPKTLEAEMKEREILARHGLLPLRKPEPQASLPIQLVPRVPPPAAPAALIHLGSLHRARQKIEPRSTPANQQYVVCRR